MCAHGSLNVRNCARTVSLAGLRQRGLFDLMPELLDDGYWKPKLFSRVRDLRNSIVSAVNPLSPVTCETAFRLASSFGGEWTMPVTTAFLALRGPPRDLEKLFRFIREVAGKESSFFLFPTHAQINHPSFVDRFGADSRLPPPKKTEPTRDFLDPLISARRSRRRRSRAGHFRPDDALGIRGDAEGPAREKGTPHLGAGILDDSNVRSSSSSDHVAATAAHTAGDDDVSGTRACE